MPQSDVRCDAHVQLLLPLRQTTKDIGKGNRGEVKPSAMLSSTRNSRNVCEPSASRLLKMSVERRQRAHAAPRQEEIVKKLTRLNSFSPNPTTVEKYLYGEKEYIDYRKSEG